GSGGRLGGVRRVRVRCLRAAGRRSGRAASFFGGSAFVSSGLAGAVAAPAGFLRPRPPRLPRRRRLGAAGCSVAPAAAGGVVTGSSGVVGALAAAAARSSMVGLRRRNNRNKWKLLG